LKALWVGRVTGNSVCGTKVHSPQPVAEPAWPASRSLRDTYAKDEEELE
jgi:hypothetical protein